MILVDTSIWIDHLRKPEPKLEELLEGDQAAIHPLIRLELALGSIANRERILSDLAFLPQVPVASVDELFQLLELRKLSRRGAGVTDLHLIASAIFDKTLSIWTRDRRLGEIAAELELRALLP